MPKSRIRKKADFTPPPEKKATSIDLRGGGRRWVAPLMLALFGIGLAWIVVFYVTNNSLPVGRVAGQLEHRGRLRLHRDRLRRLHPVEIRVIHKLIHSLG